MNGSDWATAVVVYLIIGLAVWFFGTLSAEDMTVQQRKYPKDGRPHWIKVVSLVAMCWLVWPLALAVAFVYVIGYGVLVSIAYSWNLSRGKVDP